VASFTHPEERTPVAHWIGDWVGSDVYVDDIELQVPLTNTGS
jgi:hypothetical protein